MLAPGVPALVCSCRGLAYFEVAVRGPASDLHSGEFGGAVANPATVLARLLASLHDAGGRVAIPGFYDRVGESPELRRRFAELPFDEAAFRADAGVPALAGEAGYSTLERLWLRPTCEVHGLLAGYTDEGAKTVLPATALAKLSCRLVGDQDPAEIHRLLREHLDRQAPPGVRVEVRYLLGAPAWRTELAGALFDAARRALLATFGREPVIVGGGGSLPVVNDLERVLGAPVLLLGFGQPGESAHAPNEWFSAESFDRGMRTVAALWEELGRRGADPGEPADGRPTVP
jgi:acetylornithine deacetylase/succinyl-diaminopimelate desuccinylase-like protein